MKIQRLWYAAILCLASLIPGSGLRAIELVPSALEQDMHKVRFEGVAAQIQADRLFAAQDDQGFGDVAPSDEPKGVFKKKSPLKAFLLSAVLPGAGQFYNGSKIKPAVFLGIEAASWVMHFNKEGEADDATTAYQAFNDLHWGKPAYQDLRTPGDSITAYTQYLVWAYTVYDDDGIGGLTHHLPDTKTQQYYEMTGKYDQFAWGWDDATRSGSDLERFYIDSCGGSGDPLRINSTIPGTIPNSPNRLTYEGMRKKANDLYNTADTWLYITLANHLISGFEAFVSAKKHNRDMAESDLEFSKVDMDVSLKSYNALRDTPYLKLSYKF